MLAFHSASHCHHIRCPTLWAHYFLSLPGPISVTLPALSSWGQDGWPVSLKDPPVSKHWDYKYEQSHVALYIGSGRFNSGLHACRVNTLPLSHFLSLRNRKHCLPPFLPFLHWLIANSFLMKNVWTPIASSPKKVREGCVCVYICVYVCVCLYTCACTWACMHVCVFEELAPAFHLPQEQGLLPGIEQRRRHPM